MDDEASKDPGVITPKLQVDETEIEGHRVFAGANFNGLANVEIPNGAQRRHSHRRHSHKHLVLKASELPTIPNQPPGTPPSQRVQFILGEDGQTNGLDDHTHECHPLFSELEMLGTNEDGDLEWKETARWIKFEENVEEGGDRWSKPHVATLSLHALFELRHLLTNGAVLLDAHITGDSQGDSQPPFERLIDLVLDQWTIRGGESVSDVREQLREVLLKKHRHQHQRHHSRNRSNVMPIIRSFAEIGRNHSTSKNGRSSSKCFSFCSKRPRTKTVPKTKCEKCTVKKKNTINGSYMSLDEGRAGGGGDKSPTHLSKSASNCSINRQFSSSHTDLGSLLNGTSVLDTRPLHNLSFMRKVPPGAEASNILVGEIDFLPTAMAAFIRLDNGILLGDLTEVPVPTRFLFMLLGPATAATCYQEIGRAMATLMSDEVFHEVAYRARNRTHILAGVDEFLDAVTVLPPGEWDPNIRIEPPAALPSQDTRKKGTGCNATDKLLEADKPTELDEMLEEERVRHESGLERSGILFGGLINDIRRKLPFYWSDFRDALAMQCVASWIFLCFACLSPIITFGGLLSEATGRNMAAMESLVSGFVCGIGYGLFSGQPLTILGSTGPVLVFETIVYDFCLQFGWNYLAFRFWIGTWIAIILVILVAIDASAFVCYITRFTEENFATLIAFIFIYKAVENVLLIGKKFPISVPMEVSLSNATSLISNNCTCIVSKSNGVPQLSTTHWSSMNKTMCSILNGTLEGPGCDPPIEMAPNVFLMSILLFLGTFLLSVQLKDFKNALFFPSKIRQFISDFAVIIAIMAMSLFDYRMGVSTPKLEVPHEFKPTLPSRGWVIDPFPEENPVILSVLLAIPPALLGTILIFMDQQITSVIINRKENKLKKGCGYHLDLFVLAVLIQICSIMGLPWFVAATVLSINHVNSLKLESECMAPGEKPQFLGVREQRITHILIFLTIGLSVFLTPMLSHIPMPVLYGVFLYMGISSLKGLQFFDRILIMFMPTKYQPDYMFLRQVPLHRVHLFTAIQLTCLACLWTIKSFSTTSILFPLMLVVMIGVRKLLDWLFTRRELKILDDVMPQLNARRDHKNDDLENCDLDNLQDKLSAPTTKKVGCMRKCAICLLGPKPSR